jgi:hypothetical protein
MLRGLSFKKNGYSLNEVQKKNILAEPSPLSVAKLILKGPLWIFSKGPLGKGTAHSKSPYEVEEVCWMTYDEIMNHPNTPPWTKESITRAEKHPGVI